MHNLEDSTHAVPRVLGVRQDVAALLRVDTRDSVPGRVVVSHAPSAAHSQANSQQVALQPQGHRRFGRDDGIACLRYVDVKDGLARNLLQGGLGAERGDEPRENGSACGASGK